MLICIYLFVDLQIHVNVAVIYVGLARQGEMMSLKVWSMAKW